MSDNEPHVTEYSEQPLTEMVSMIPCTNQSIWADKAPFGAFNPKELETLGSIAPATESSDGKSQDPIDFGIVFKKQNILIEHCVAGYFLSSDNQIFYVTTNTHTEKHWKPVTWSEHVKVLTLEMKIQNIYVPKEICPEILVLLDDGYWYTLSIEEAELNKVMEVKNFCCLGYDDMRQTEWGDCDIRITLFDNHVYYQDEELGAGISCVIRSLEETHSSAHPNEPFEVPDRFTHSYEELTHINYFDDKNPRAVVATVTCAYVLCDDGVFIVGDCYYRGIYYLGEDKEVNRNDFIHKIEFFADKQIRKLVSMELSVICWCEDGLYFWGEIYPEITYEHVTKLGNPIRFFAEKTILDVAPCGEYYCVLTTEGMFSFKGEGVPDSIEGGIVKISDIPFSVDSNLPCMFNYYRSVISKRKKRAFQHSTEDNQQTDSAKKYKLS